MIQDRRQHGLCDGRVNSLSQSIISEETRTVLNELQNTETIKEGVDADAQDDRAQDCIEGKGVSIGEVNGIRHWRTG